MRLLSKIRALIPISSISLVQFKNSEDPDDDMLNQSYLSLVRDLGNSMYFQYLMGLYRDDYKISLFYQISEQIKSEWYQEIFYGNTKSYGVNRLYKSS